MAQKLVAETGLGLGNLIKHREGIVEARRESTRGKNKFKKKGIGIIAFEFGAKDLSVDLFEVEEAGGGGESGGESGGSGGVCVKLKREDGG